MFPRFAVHGGRQLSGALVAGTEQMNKLFGYIYILAGTVLAGVAVTAALTIGRDGATEIATAAAAGAVIALPVAWLVANKLAALR